MCRSFLVSPDLDRYTSGWCLGLSLRAEFTLFGPKQFDLWGNYMQLCGNLKPVGKMYRITHPLSNPFLLLLPIIEAYSYLR